MEYDYQFLDATIIVDNLTVFPPTVHAEIIIKLILNDYQNKDTSQLKLLDMCSGSGVIGVVLQKVLGFQKTTTADISKDAIEVIDNNRKDNHIELDIIESDGFNKINDTYDIITAVPPYSPTSECDRNYYTATNGGENGDEVIDKIIYGSYSHLNDGGVLYLAVKTLDLVNKAEILLGIEGFSDIQVLTSDLLANRYFIKAIKE